LEISVNAWDNGWHITVGGGYKFTPHFDTTLDYTFNGFGVSRGVLNEAQVPDGDAHVWSITVNPKLRLNPSGKVDPYIVGGVGYYRRQFTLPSRPWWMCSSSIHFFGVFFNTLVPANQVIGEITNSGAGGSLGAGFDMGIGNTGLKFFSEARYHYADTGRIPTRMVPLTFGIQW